MIKKYMLIIVTSIALGIIIGSYIKEDNRQKDSYTNKQDYVLEKKNQLNEYIKNLNDYKEDLNKELTQINLKFSNSSQMKQLNKLKEDLSYTDINGEGIIIDLDSSSNEVGNIANIIEFNKIFISLINALKVNGAKFICINDQRLNQYSEIILAGNHININSKPIGQPYEIKVIGNLDKLKKYIGKENTYLEAIQKNYPISMKVKVSRNISMSKINTQNSLEYIRGE